MNLQFPNNFIWGTSTAAAQIETAYDHEWKGLKARDGAVFNRTADHELRRTEDLKFIIELGKAYRMSLDWSRLQRQPFAPFAPDVVEEYTAFFEALKANNIYIMLVLHHFTNPNWFALQGNWTNKRTIPMFVDYVQQVLKHFGKYVNNFNTFNEPQAYAFSAFLMGNFPPHKKSIWATKSVINNMSAAHKIVVPIIKQHCPNALIGISNNTAYFKAYNALGFVPEKLLNYVYNNYVADQFNEGTDYTGISYYAKIGLKHYALTELDKPGELDKLGKPHDKMWEYYPEGMGLNIDNYWKRYGKPIMVTESGICTDDCDVRINSIKDYLQVIYKRISSGVPILGYFHWSTIDNFEWNLGNSYRFGLVHVDFKTGERTMKKSGEFYKQLVQNNGFSL